MMMTNITPLHSLSQPQANLVTRTAVDLTLQCVQRTLYIARKVAQQKSLTSSEEAWSRCDHASRVRTIIRGVIPKEYCSDLYRYLLIPEEHRQRAAVIFNAQRLGQLAPWDTRLLTMPADEIAGLFKPADEIKAIWDKLWFAPAAVLASKTTGRRPDKKGTQRARRLSKVVWGLLSPRQKKQFRLSKTKPRLLRKKLRLATKRVPVLQKWQKLKSFKAQSAWVQLLRLRVKRNQPTRPARLFRACLTHDAIEFWRRSAPTYRLGAFYDYTLKTQRQLRRRRSCLFTRARPKSPVLGSVQTFSPTVALVNGRVWNTQPQQVLTGRVVVRHLLNQGARLHYDKTKILPPRGDRGLLAQRHRYRKLTHSYFFSHAMIHAADTLKYRFNHDAGGAKYRLTVFRNFFRRKFAKFRHISKNRLFISLFRAHFTATTGYDQKELMWMWFQFRRKHTKFWGPANLVSRFAQSILLTVPHLALFFGIAPTLAAAHALTRIGAIAVNGTPAVSRDVFARPGDTIQLTPSLWARVRGLYFYQQWSYIQLKLTRVSFFQVDWSMLMFTLVTWPQKYELLPPSYLSERWIRFYIRYFPVRQRKYQKVKMLWKTYPRHVSRRHKTPTSASLE